MKRNNKKPIISIVMGSQSDWSTLSKCTEILEQLEVKFEKKIISAHRTPDRLYKFAKNLKNTSIKVIIAGAGGAAHLPGMLASLTHLPVLGVPIESKTLKGIDSLLSIVQMPAGIPLPTLAIGEVGAKNAVLAAASILSLSDTKIKNNLLQFRKEQTQSVPKIPLNSK